MYEARLVLFPNALAYRFCMPGWRAGRPLARDAVLAALASADPARCGRVVFAGGSPLEHPDFDELAARAREAGFAQLALETDGRALSEAALDRLEKAGIRTLFVVAGGIRAAVHDLVLRDPGTLREAMEGVRRALHGPFETWVVVPALQATRADVEPLLDWLLQAGGRLHGFLLAPPDPALVPKAARAQLLPGRALAALAAAVFRTCQGRGVQTGFAERRGLPPCAAGGLLDKWGSVFRDRVEWFRHAGGPLVRVRACAGCSLSKACRGLEPEHLETFGEEGLEPVPLEVSMAWPQRPLNDLAPPDYRHVSPFRNDAAVPQRGLLRVNGRCNMGCAFCFTDRTAADFDPHELSREIERMAADGHDHLVLSGGEPTLHAALPELVSRAFSLGFRTIELQTNGVLAADPALAGDLVGRGLNKVTVSLHSTDPAHSDAITRLPGGFAKSVQALHNFRRLGVKTQVAHVITRANYRELPATVRFLRETFGPPGPPPEICFSIAQSISDLVYAWVIPTFTEIRPFLREALDDCLAHGVGFGGLVGQGGFPPCTLGGDLRYYRDVLDRIYRSEDGAAQFHKAPRCRDCAFDALCVGVRRSYIEHYGDAELVPFRAEGLPLEGLALPVVARDGVGERP